MAYAMPFLENPPGNSLWNMRRSGRIFRLFGRLFGCAFTSAIFAILLLFLLLRIAGLHIADFAFQKAFGCLYGFIFAFIHELPQLTIPCNEQSACRRTDGKTDHKFLHNTLLPIVYAMRKGIHTLSAPPISATYPAFRLILRYPAFPCARQYAKVPVAPCFLPAGNPPPF